MKILVIDDEEDIRHIARISLEKIGGMTVLEAGSAPEGVQKAQTEKPDVILLDVMMPGKDGPETFMALQNNPDTSSIPVVFLTAKAMKSEINRLTTLGAAGVITKPFDPMKLSLQIRSFIKPSKNAD